MRIKYFLVLAAFLFPRFASAQGALLPDFMQQYSDALGVPVASGFVCTTISSTTTSLATYPTAADAVAGTNANSNPVQLDSAGRASIFMGSGTYRAVLLNPVGIGSSTCNGTPTGSAIKTVDGITLFGSALVIENINGIRYCNAFPGSTAGAKIAACLADLPATGGVADASGFTGVQTINIDVFNGISKPVTLLLGNAAFTISTTQHYPGSNFPFTIRGVKGQTVINYTGTGFLFDSTDGNIHTADSEISGLTIAVNTSGASGIRVGRVDTDYAENLLKLRWNIHDIYILGPGASTSGSIGLSVTELLGHVVTNVTIVDFEKSAIIDRSGNGTWTRVRFQAFKDGPWITNKGGAGTVAAGSSQDTFINPEFLGPTSGSGDTVTVENQNITFINALYECQAGGTATNMLNLNSRGTGNADSAYFIDIGGFFSFTGGCGGATHTINFANGFAAPQFNHTDIPVAGYPPIVFGTIYSGGSDDYTAKFNQTAYQLNVLARAADTGMTKAVITDAPASTTSGHILTQSQIHDQTGMLRALDTTSYTNIVPTTGKGIELWYQDSGDQGLINCAERVGAATNYKPCLIQGSTVSVSNGTSTMLAINGNGSIFRGSITGSTTSPAIQYVSGSTGSIGASSNASVTLNWSNTWADTGYYPLCQVTEATNLDTLVFHKVTGVSTSQITAVIANVDSGSARTGTLNCVGFHP